MWSTNEPRGLAYTTTKVANKVRGNFTSNYVLNVLVHKWVPLCDRSGNCWNMRYATVIEVAVKRYLKHCEHGVGPQFSMGSQVVFWFGVCLVFQIHCILTSSMPPKRWNKEKEGQSGTNSEGNNVSSRRNKRLNKKPAKYYMAMHDVRKHGVEKTAGESSEAPGTESDTITEERASSCTADGALSSSLEGQVHGKESEREVLVSDNRSHSASGHNTDKELDEKLSKFQSMKKMQELEDQPRQRVQNLERLLVEHKELKLSAAEVRTEVVSCWNKKQGINDCTTTKITRASNIGCPNP